MSEKSEMYIVVGHENDDDDISQFKCCKYVEEIDFIGENNTFSEEDKEVEKINLFNFRHMDVVDDVFIDVVNDDGITGVEFCILMAKFPKVNEVTVECMLFTCEDEVNMVFNYCENHGIHINIEDYNVSELIEDFYFDFNTTGELNDNMPEKYRTASTKDVKRVSKLIIADTVRAFECRKKEHETPLIKCATKIN